MEYLALLFLFLKIGTSYEDVSTPFNLTEEEKEEKDFWSSWSSWSSCSRTCGRGVSVQSRRCANILGCRGSSVKYHICNPEECPHSATNFRSLQCAEYNTIRYGGKLQEWVAAEDAEASSCSLKCRPKGTNSAPVTLNPRVIDGTECGENRSGICVHGHCQEVGCDLVIGSRKKKDRCGVCGGDDSTCAISVQAKWVAIPSQPCSTTCGGGFLQVEVICKDTGTGRKVSEENCAPGDRPIGHRKFPCALQPCIPSWRIGSWGECSNSCGKGHQGREVSCVTRKNGTTIIVADRECSEPRPSQRRSCAKFACPSWYAGLWSQCSSSCGRGFQRRVVQCRDKNGRSSKRCDNVSRPASTRPCISSITCAHSHHSSTTISLPGWLKKDPDHSSSRFIASSEPLNDEESVTPVPAEPTFIKSGWSSCSATCGAGIQKRVVTCKIFLEFSETIAVLPDAHCPGARPVHVQPCNLGPCAPLMLSESSDDENTYISNRLTSLESDEPQIAIRGKEDPPFFDQKKGVALKLRSSHKEPSSGSDFKYAAEYPGRNAKDQNPRIISLDSHRNPRISLKEKEQYEIFHHNTDQKYVWKPSGYTPCSASCLGGYQESVSYCVREKDGKRVEVHKCDLNTRPKVYTKSCNEDPCSPHWETSEFGPCSKSCSGGITRRQVKCVHQFATSAMGTVTLPDSECPQPPPYAQKFCNMMPCENVEEKVESSDCADEQEKSPSSPRCRGHGCKSKASRKKKKKKKMRRRKGPAIKALLSQNYKQKKFMKTVVLKVGGKAEVFHGSDIKIKCPVRRFQREKIKWWKNGRPISSKDKTEGRRKNRVNKKGVLKIYRVQYADAAVYSCSAGEEKANLVLQVEPLPASFVDSSDVGQVITASEERSKSRGSGGVVYSEPITNHIDILPPLLTPNHFESGKPKMREAEDAEVEDPKQVVTGETSLSQEFFSRNRNASVGGGPAEVDPASQGPPIYGKVAHHGIPARERYSPTRGISLLSDKIARSKRLNSTPSESLPIQGVQGSPPSASQKEESNPIYGILLNSTRTDSGGRVTKEGNAYFGTVVANVDPSSPSARTEGGKRVSPLQSFFLSSQKLRDHKERSTEDIIERMKGPLDSLFAKRDGNGKSLFSEDQGFGPPLFLGKGSRESLKFEWKVTNWTQCSQTCSFSGASGGYQVRSTQCVVRVNNISQSVDGALCEDAGLGAPQTIQRCGFEECPQWKVDGWSNCATSSCFTLHYAYNTRKVICVLHNGTRVPHSKCDEVMKPNTKRKCYNRECVGVWRTGNWSKCTAPCGGQGYRTRLLQCVWNGTEKSAGNACREQPRPEVVKWCDGDPCIDRPSGEEDDDTLEPQCRDQSRYCKIVQRINMCRIKHYRRKCCRSCRND